MEIIDFELQILWLPKGVEVRTDVDGQVKIGGDTYFYKDIKDKIVSVSYKEEIMTFSKLDLTFRGLFMDNPAFIEGNGMKFIVSIGDDEFVYRKIEKYMRIVSLSFDFDSGITTVGAVDNGRVLMEFLSNYVGKSKKEVVKAYLKGRQWKGVKRASQVVTDICEEWASMSFPIIKKYFVAKTYETVDTKGNGVVYQKKAGMSDWEYLHKLAKQTGCVVFIENDVLYFVPIILAKEPRLVLSYNMKNSRIVNPSISVMPMDIKEAGKTDINEKSGKVESKTADITDIKKDTLGKDLNENSVVDKGTPQKPPPMTIKVENMDYLHPQGLPVP